MVAEATARFAGAVVERLMLRGVSCVEVDVEDADSMRFDARTTAHEHATILGRIYSAEARVFAARYPDLSLPTRSVP